MNLYKEIVSELPLNRRKFPHVILNFLFDQPFKIMINFRIGQYLSKSRNPILRLLSRSFKNRQFRNWSCDISYQAVIGKGVKFGHPIGIVIGAKCIIENDVKIWQNVTLGSHGKESLHEKSYPVIKSGARIYAGAKVIGGVVVGYNSVVAANAVVNIDVADNSVAIGIPCKIIKKKSE